MTNTEIRKKILDFCYKDVLGFTSLYVEKNKGKNWLEVNMSSEFNDLVDKLYQAVIELLSQEIEKAREEVADEVAREIGYGKLSGEEYYKTLNRVIKLISKLKDSK